MKKLYFVSMSGGKDSTATAIYMLKHYPRNKLRFIFADTGWEHPKTYEYIKYLEKRLKIRIFTVKSKKYNNMEDLCIAKKMFPNRVKKFCTTELKIIPIMELYTRYKDKVIELYQLLVLELMKVKKEKAKIFGKQTLLMHQNLDNGKN
ncbi:phosphoadenosine phosphosulfate reductase family protein [Sulfurimonas sp.]|uniref:phosphoadenosine phosphosulfate reductase family protein n=1 Tax=Sulfurimonas sp. TaxID=2022749 RepID=UPI0025EC258A|nr:phosphoadenosine phosphosulfate reductase family protein [Sulfurimonas sp.]